MTFYPILTIINSWKFSSYYHTSAKLHLLSCIKLKKFPSPITGYLKKHAAKWPTLFQKVVFTSKQSNTSNQCFSIKINHFIDSVFDHNYIQQLILHPPLLAVEVVHSSSNHLQQNVTHLSGYCLVTNSFQGCGVMFTYIYLSLYRCTSMC